MQPFIQAFVHEAPNVQLVINSIQSGEISQAVTDGAADIGINCEKDSYPDAVVPTYSIKEELKNGSLMPVKTELDKNNMIRFIFIIRISG